MRDVYVNRHPFCRRAKAGLCRVQRLALCVRSVEPYRPHFQERDEVLTAMHETWERDLRRMVRWLDEQSAAFVAARQNREPEMLRSPYDEQDTAEIRMMRALGELNQRILMTPDPAQRTQLRLTVATLRAELIKLIEAIPIHSEADVESFRASHHGMALQVAPPRYT